VADVSSWFQWIWDGKRQNADWFVVWIVRCQSVPDDPRDAGKQGTQQGKDEMGSSGAT
jgi:hypothetical protein